MKQLFILSLLLLAGVLLNSCSTPMPTSFNRNDTSWVAIKVRDDMDYDKVWFRVFDVIARELDITLYSKEQGYIQTQWNTGSNTGYETRVKLRFSEDRKVILLRTEAHYLTENGWIVGVDTQQLKIVRDDIAGLVSTALR